MDVCRLADWFIAQSVLSTHKMYDKVSICAIIVCTLFWPFAVTENVADMTFRTTFEIMHGFSVNYRNNRNTQVGQ